MDIERPTLATNDLNEIFRLLEEKIENKVNDDGGIAFASCHEILGFITETTGKYSDEVKTNSNLKYRIDELITLATICICGAASINSDKLL